KDFGPLMDMTQAMPYTAVQRLIDDANPKGMLNYWTGDFYGNLSDEAIDLFVGKATKPVSTMTQNIVIPAGGAIARIPDDAMAFGNRDAAFSIHYLSMWQDPAETEKNIAFTRDLAGAMKPWSTGGSYLNFLGDEGLGRIEASFGPAKWKRLRELKKKWDPQNLFRINQNIPPAD
ncbi:MAG TPA: BBE domain-containing protein, partial [Acidimicrobiia bacterium]|nr:BBE domain-containing protein [Acidimicrobiia bacterium]